MDPEDAIGWLLVLFCALIVAGLVALGVRAWQDGQDKRACRKRGGEIVSKSGEWRCAMTQPERAP